VAKVQEADDESPSARCVASLIRAHAAVGTTPSDPLKAKICQNLSHFSAEETATVVWAFGKVGWGHESTIVRALLRRLLKVVLDLQPHQVCVFALIGLNLCVCICTYIYAYIRTCIHTLNWCVCVSCMK
jgi:hypothetical protein